MTEKVYNGLQAGTLPVYWGADNVEHYVPRGSVVKVREKATGEAGGDDSDVPIRG